MYLDFVLDGVLVPLCLVLVAICPIVLAAPRLEEVPEFSVRARLESNQDWRLTVGGTELAAPAKRGEWSPWVSVTKAHLAKILAGYPNSYIRHWLVVVHLGLSPVGELTTASVEAKIGDMTYSGQAKLYGPALGLVLSREGDKVSIATMAEHNRKRYWSHLPENTRRPERIVLVDRFISGDNDAIALEEGIRNLARMGVNAIMLPPDKRQREILLSTGLRRTAWAVYNPPGYAFDFDPNTTSDEALGNWAREQAKPYLDAGYDRTDMAIFATSDEPGWYYPAMLNQVNSNPALLARFHEYLKTLGLRPKDFGAKSWHDLRLIGRGQAVTLETRRLFYWSMRFFPSVSSRYFARVARALEQAFYPGMPVTVNWNFFAGRFYVPGPVANNPDKQNPDAAMGGHDWFEFGRVRGSTALWTEDWFDDSQAYQWSFYGAKLASAARKSGVRFGGYIVPRTAGSRSDGMVQRLLALVGHGAKVIEYYTFGPEYNFPGNCWSENTAVYAPMVRAADMLARGESLLYPGEPAPTQVAILMPQSSQLWDSKDQRIAHGIDDATNTNLNARTVDYMAEVFDLWLALMHSNIQVDFVDELDLLSGLPTYRVLYVTEPNVPRECQEALADWVKRGGTLVTVSGAATRDRYDEPLDLLRKVRGLSEKERPRVVVPLVSHLDKAGVVAGEVGSADAHGPRSHVEPRSAQVLAKFDDGLPALTLNRYRKGRAYHFAFLPGISYFRSAGEAKDRLPAGFSDVLRGYITMPVRDTELQGRPILVNPPLIEAPTLLSREGMAVTLLNWRGEPVPLVELQIPWEGHLPRASSVLRGPIQPERNGDRLIVKLPLDAADVVLLSR